jgi:hypothetical protein
MITSRNSTGGFDASDTAQTTGAPSAPTCILQSQWHQERLTEARGIVADIGHHPDTLVLLACRAICTHSTEASERADALGLIGLLEARTPHWPSNPQRIGS